MLARHGESRAQPAPRPPANRYEYAQPGELVDAKKLGRFWQVGKHVLGGKRRNPNAGWQHAHVAVDDHSRWAMVELRPAEDAESCTSFLSSVISAYSEQGITIRRVMTDVAGIVFTHGSHGGAAEAERVDYGAVRNVLDALGTRPARIALMTAIGVTKHTPGHDWKRRGERLVRASGLPYTIVRPGWFDYNQPDQQRLVMLQGDSRWAGDPSDGVVSRAQIAQVLIASLTSEAANRKSFELVAEPGPAQTDLDPLFQTLQPDPTGALDAVRDQENMPIDQEPPTVIADLESAKRREH